MTDPRSLPELFEEVRDMIRFHPHSARHTKNALAALDAIAERQHVIDGGLCNCNLWATGHDCLALRAACKGVKP